jgi:hypothetical protein
LASGGHDFLVAIMLMPYTYAGKWLAKMSRESKYVGVVSNEGFGGSAGVYSALIRLLSANAPQTLIGT